MEVPVSIMWELLLCSWHPVSLCRHWENKDEKLSFFCATFKRAVITMTKEGLPCFWHFATINLSQDSFPSSALHSVFNMKNCTAQLTIVVALLRAWQKFGLYSAPFPWVSSYLDSQGTQVIQRGKSSKIILIIHRTTMLSILVFYYFLLNHCGICWFYFFLQANNLHISLPQK